MKNLNFKVSIFKFRLILPIALLSVFSINAQTKTTPNQIVNDTVKNSKPLPEKNKVFSVIEKMPVFPGGENALLSYIGHNLKYPKEAQQKGIQGRILVRFVVNKLGKVENAEVVKGLETSIDKEGIRVINSLPDWTPGEQKGEKVSVYYTIPLTFKLTYNDSKPSTPDPKKMPVFILDGKVLPLEYNYATINKDSIQGVNVLKSDTKEEKAELISKYGKRAANGVIEITRKK